MVCMSSPCLQQEGRAVHGRFIHDLMVHVAEGLGNQHGPGAPFL